MNAERLLAHFEEISEAPDAVARLRRFILDLAVRGKLLEQDPEDEPAEELLESITAEKHYLETMGEIRASKKVPDPEDPLFGIPATWVWTQLACIGSIGPRNDAPDSASASFVPMTLISAEYGVPNGHKVRPWGEIKKGYTHFAEGDVGLAKITPCFENGKSAVFHSLTGGIGSGTTELHVIRPLQISPGYILIFLKSPHFIQAGIPRMTGTAGQKRVPLDYFAHSPFPLPPLAEQHRIVAKVDDLMALCDKLEASRQKREQIRERLVSATLQRLNQPAEDIETSRSDARFALQVLPALTTTPTQIKQLRQTILSLAVRGKLVEQERSAEEQYKLFEGIKADQLVALMTKRIKQKVAALSTLTDEMLIDKSFRPESVSLASIVVFGPQNGISPPEVTDPSAPKALTLSATTSGVFDAKCFKHVNLATEACEPYWLTSGDLLFQRGNTREYVGMAAIYDGQDRSFVFPDLMIRVRISSNVSLKYVHIALISPCLRAYLTSNATGSSETMPKINQEVLLNAPIPLPPLAEQHRIVAKVDELMALCDQLEQQLSQTDQRRRRLLEAVLAEALREPEKALASTGSA
jgi:type I restriction enzyme S subunit